MRTEDGYIIQECLNGESEAFGVLVDKYREGIYAFVYSKLRDFQDAQDVTQEVFLHAYRNLRTLRRWESFASWLYRIASRRSKLWIRTVSRRVDRDFIEDQHPEVMEDYSMDSYRDNQVSESLQEAMNSLSETYREVLMLHYFGGMSIKDMARAIGVSPGAIGMRLSRARAQLKEEMVVMMDTAFEGQGLPAGFTFRIVEAVKRIKVQPMPRTAGLPWGLSLATGIILVVLSLNPHMSTLDPASFPMSSSLPVEAKSLERGEIPVVVMADPEILPIPGRQEDIAEALHFAEAQAAPNKGRIVFSRSGNIWVMDATGEDEKQLTAQDDEDSDPVWSPDGTQIAFTRWSDDGNSGDIYIMKANGSDVRRLTEGPENDMDPCWSPDGKRIAFSRIVIEKKGNQWNWISGAIYVVDIDGADLVNLTEGLPFAGDPNWSSDGSRIVFHIDNAGDTAKPFQIWTMDSDGKNRRKLISGGRNPAWSPDGKSIAFSRQQGPGIPSDIYIMGADGANIRRVNDPWPSWEESPKWSPDGTKIVFFSNKDGETAIHIYIMDVDGSNVQRLTNNPAYRDRFPDWTTFSYAIEPSGKLPTTWGEVKSD